MSSDSDSSGSEESDEHMQKPTPKMSVKPNGKPQKTSRVGTGRRKISFAFSGHFWVTCNRKLHVMMYL